MPGAIEFPASLSMTKPGTFLLVVSWILTAYTKATMPTETPWKFVNKRSTEIRLLKN
jgi:hypothetical protein